MSKYMVNDWVVLINLIVIAVAMIALPIIWIAYFGFLKKRTPSWITYATLGTIILYCLDAWWRDDWELSWGIGGIFVMFLFLVVEQFQYQREDANADAAKDADQSQD